MPKIAVAPESGTRQGKLVVLEETRETRPSGVSYRALKCQCDCGNVTVIALSEWTRKDKNPAQSCGCEQFKGGGRKVSDRYNIKIGDKFNRLTVKEIKNSKIGKRVVICICDCGNVTDEIFLPHLVNGVTTSCGCYNKEVARERMLNREAPKGEAHPGYKHGLSLKGNKNPHYSRWQLMMRRCYNPDDKGYQSRYGVLGIKVYEPWHDVVTFCREIEELLGPCPVGNTIDRIDVLGDYTPDNVRWATKKEQSANTEWAHKSRDAAALEIHKTFREKFPGHSQDWYVTLMKRSALKVAGVPESELPELPDK